MRAFLLSPPLLLSKKKTIIKRANKHFPSSLGPRSCIGLQFAKSEFHCLLAAVIGRFEVELEPKDKEIGVETGIVARPKGGLKLRMRVVDGW